MHTLIIILILQIIISSGAPQQPQHHISCKQQYSNGRGRIHSAVIWDNPEELMDLLENGANINSYDMEGITPLHLAVICHNIAIMKCLIFHGADVNSKTYKFEWTPLHLAIIYMNEDIEEILIDLGANKEIKDKLGRSPQDLKEEMNNCI